MALFAVSVLLFHRTLLWYYAEGMHVHFKENLIEIQAMTDGASAKAIPFHALIVSNIRKSNQDGGSIFIK